MRKKKVVREHGVNAEGERYLTKRLLVSLANKGIKNAAEETMKIMGFNVIAENGWVVKVFADGRKEQIKQLPYVQRPEKIVLL